MRELSEDEIELLACFALLSEEYKGNILERCSLLLVQQAIDDFKNRSQIYEIKK